MANSVRCIALVMSLSASVVPAAAQEGARSDPGPVTRAGWYGAPLVTVMKPDSSRCQVDDGLGASALFGHRGEFGSLEFWGQFMALEHGECTYTVPAPTETDPENRETVTEPSGEVKLNGAGFALLVGPFFEDRFLQRFFGLLGFGVLRRTDHPQYPHDDSTMFGDVGMGYLHPIGPNTAARIDVRYRYDVQQPPHPDEQDPPPEHAYQDLILNIGFQFALSPEESASQPTPAPAAVVPVEQTDADRDGVPDERDQCPGTAIGQAVDQNGCEAVSSIEPTSRSSSSEPTTETAADSEG